MELEKRVFSKKEFVEAASKNFVLVEVDFPNNKEQPAEVKAQNEKLMKSFGVAAFPTLLLSDAEGRPYAEAGFPEPLSPDGMKELLDKQKKVRIQRDQFFAEAAKAEGIEKAKLLIEALKVLPEAFVSGAYESTIDEIAKLDPEDKTGFVEAAQSRRALAELEASFGALMEGESYDDAIKLVDGFVEKRKPKGETKQKVLLFKFFGLATKEEFDAALKLVDEIVAIDSETQTATLAKQFKRQLDSRESEGEKNED